MYKYFRIILILSIPIICVFLLFLVLIGIYKIQFFFNNMNTLVVHLYINTLNTSYIFNLYIYNKLYSNYKFASKQREAVNCFRVCIQAVSN